MAAAVVEEEVGETGVAPVDKGVTEEVDTAADQVEILEAVDMEIKVCCLLQSIK